MKTIKIANKEYIFAELASNQSWNPEFPTHLTWELSIGTYSEPYIIPIFDLDSWRKDTKIITTTNSITEEIAGNVVEKWRMIQGEIGQGDANLFTNYLNLFSSSATAFTNTALESFYSLMDSLELDRNNKNYLLIEKL